MPLKVLGYSYYQQSIYVSRNINVKLNKQNILVYFKNLKDKKSND